MLDTFQTNSIALPFFNLDSPADKAKLLHRLMLDLAKDEPEKQLKSAVRQTADFFREKFFGLSDTQIKLRITETLKEYFDGETYNGLEIDNLAELTGVSEEKLLPVLERLVADGTIAQGRRRRWQELGKHYNLIYSLNEEKQVKNKRKNA